MQVSTVLEQKVKPKVTQGQIRVVRSFVVIPQGKGALVTNNPNSRYLILKIEILSLVNLY